MKRLPLSLEAESVASVAMDDWRDPDAVHTCSAGCPCHAFWAAHGAILRYGPEGTGEGDWARSECSCGWVDDEWWPAGYPNQLRHTPAFANYEKHVRAERRKQPRW